MTNHGALECISWQMIFSERQLANFLMILCNHGNHGNQSPCRSEASSHLNRYVFEPQSYDDSLLRFLYILTLPLFAMYITTRIPGYANFNKYLKSPLLPHNTEFRFSNTPP